MTLWIEANLWLLAAAAFSFAGALLHIGCIIGGAGWYRVLGAGEAAVRAVARGQLRPHLMAGAVAIILLAWVAYALAAAGLLPLLPFTKAALAAIVAVLLARGLLIVVPGRWRPDLGLAFKFWSSLYVLIMAGLFAIGAAQRWHLL